MKHLILIIFLSQFLVNSYSQQTNVESVNINQLKARFENSNDTIFFVNFWATWCKPCVEEMPLIENIQSSFKGIPVKVLLVSLDFKSQLESRLIPFIKENYIQSEVLILDEGNPNEWIPKVDKSWSGAIPACWIYHNKQEVFHEGQVNLKIIDDLLSKSISE